MVKFLYDKSKRTLHITGQSGLGKTTLARRALNLATVRDPEQLFKDGVLCIDMENISSISQLEDKLSEKLTQSQTNLQYDLNDIVIHLNKKRMCLVFDGCDNLLNCETEEAL
jgi:ABC-type glutathione transport system ATPase component